MSRASRPRRPPVVILCGGRGTRLAAGNGGAGEIIKPLVEIGGLPIVWHVIALYAAHGFERFLLATGHRGELIERFVADARWPARVRVECVDTGADTNSGGRIKLLEPALADEQLFCASYADGLADIELDALLAYHRGHGKIGTMTAVRPQLPFGVAELEPDGRVSGFREKPRSEHWINGGFFCFSGRFLAYLEHGSVLEREPLATLAAEGQLRAYRHAGFWRCMDTYKDTLALNEEYSEGAAPWLRSQRAPALSAG